MREEFDLQGQDFSNRGNRLDEMIVALRELWEGGWVEFHGEHYDLPPLTMEPHPPAQVPIYVGGHSDAAPAPGRAARRRLDRQRLPVGRGGRTRRPAQGATSPSTGVPTTSSRSSAACS